MNDDDLLKASEAATLLNVGLRTFERFVANDRIPIYRLPSGHRRFRRADVQALAVVTPVS